MIVVGTNTLDFRKSSLHFAGVDHAEQTEAFQKALEALVEQYCHEYDLTFAQIVGVLQIKIVELALESIEPEEKDKPHG